MMFFQIRQPRRFHHKPIYVDKRKERLEPLQHREQQKGKDTENVAFAPMSFRSSRLRGCKDKANRRGTHMVYILFLALFLFLFVFCYYIMYKKL